jgi:uncharacterized protein YndB with AHSA1/START domain
MMHRLHFSIDIKAPKEKIWKVFLEDETYRLWTSPFAEGSHAVTDWKEGSKALFLSPDGNGLVSTIVKHVPNEFLSIKHLGGIKNGVEDTQSDEVTKWAGGLENYTLKEADGTSELAIDIDVTDDTEKYFTETWPKALQKLKELSEAP